MASSELLASAVSSRKCIADSVYSLNAQQMDLLHDMLTAYYRTYRDVVPKDGVARACTQNHEPNVAPLRAKGTLSYRATTLWCQRGPSSEVKPAMLNPRRLSVVDELVYCTDLLL